SLGRERHVRLYALVPELVSTLNAHAALPGVISMISLPTGQLPSKSFAGVVVRGTPVTGSLQKIAIHPETVDSLTSAVVPSVITVAVTDTIGANEMLLEAEPPIETVCPAATPSVIQEPVLRVIVSPVPPLSAKVRVGAPVIAKRTSASAWWWKPKPKKLPRLNPTQPRPRAWVLNVSK